MADQTIPPKPRYGTVESFEDLMRRLAGESGLYPYALGAIEGIITGLNTSDTDKVKHVKNVLIAVGRLAKRPSDPTGLGYSREADDPTPVSGARVEMHTGAVTDEGLVDETVPRCPNCHGRHHTVEGCH